MDCYQATANAALSARTWLWIALFFIIDDLWYVGYNREFRLIVMCLMRSTQIKRKYIYPRRFYTYHRYFHENAFLYKYVHKTHHEVCE